MNKIVQKAQEFLIDSGIDAVAVAKLDFNNHSFEHFEIYSGEVNSKEAFVYFDLASLTKSLTNSFVWVANDINDPKLELLLNHKAGLPAWGLLPKHGWKDQLLSYEIKASDTLYSDFSALRLMLELESKLGKNFKEMVFQNLDPKIKSWLDLDGSEICLQNGYYAGQPNIGKVHDPNAYNLGCFTSHAGLFSPIDSLAKTLIDFNKKYDLNTKVKSNMGFERFCLGFDTVTDLDKTLAGQGCSNKTFGHLGFTGTSFWIDTEKNIGSVILSNATKYYWFNKVLLNQFRREVGGLIWEG